MTVAEQSLTRPLLLFLRRAGTRTQPLVVTHVLSDASQRASPGGRMDRRREGGVDRRLDGREEVASLVCSAGRREPEGRRDCGLHRAAHRVLGQRLRREGWGRRRCVCPPRAPAVYGTEPRPPAAAGQADRARHRTWRRGMKRKHSSAPGQRQSPQCLWASPPHRAGLPGDQQRCPDTGVTRSPARTGPLLPGATPLQNPPLAGRPAWPWLRGFGADPRSHVQTPPSQLCQPQQRALWGAAGARGDGSDSGPHSVLRDGRGAWTPGCEKGFCLSPHNLTDQGDPPGDPAV